MGESGVRDKLREKRLRARARESELQLVRALTFNRRAAHYGTYALIHSVRNILVVADPQSGFGMTLDDIETYLDGVSRLRQKIAGSATKVEPDRIEG